MKRIVLLVIAFFVFNVTAAMAGPIVLKAGHSANSNEPYHIGLQAFADALKEKTNGEVEVKIYANSVLGTEQDMLQGLYLGNVDVTVPTNGVLTNFVPELAIFDLPFLFENREEMYKAVDGRLGEKLAEAMKKKGFRLLSFYEAGVRHIMTKDKPINSIEDLKGLKIRTMQIPAHIDAFNAFGAKATPLAYSELYSALESGVVDGAEAANTNYYSKQFYNVAPNWAQIGWTILVADLVMSEAKFQSFSPEIQEAILEAAKESAQVERKVYAKSDAELLNKLKEQGVNITYPDPTPFIEKAKIVYKKHASTPEMKELLNLIK